jgi:LysM repeat protein
VVGTVAQFVAPAAPAVNAAAVTVDIEALPEAVPVRTEPPTTVRAKVVAPNVTAPATPAPAAEAAAATRTERLPAVKPSCAKQYTVRAGDAWITIAKKAGVTTKELLKANAATGTTAIYPGRDICLPANANSPAAASSPTPVKSAQKSAAPKPTTTTTTTTVPARIYTKAEVAQIIRDVWPDELEDEAIRIATRESNLVPTAKNYCCYGLFQVHFNVHQRWLSQMGVTSAHQLLDPRTNALAGLALWNRSGSWSPWN